MAFVVHPPFVHLLLFTPACADIRDNGITAVLQVVTRNLELIGTKSFVSPPLLTFRGIHAQSLTSFLFLPPSPCLPGLRNYLRKITEERNAAGRFWDISIIYQRRWNNPLVDRYRYHLASLPPLPSSPVERIDERVTGSARVSGFN